MDYIRNKIIYVDIDGVICTNEGTDYKKARPIEENIKLINELYKNNKIVIWTARGTLMEEDFKELTEKQLRDWGVKYHELLFGKPYYDILIDDRSISDFRQLQKKN